jgi:hypothetical protein
MELNLGTRVDVYWYASNEWYFQFVTHTAAQVGVTQGVQFKLTEFICNAQQIPFFFFPSSSHFNTVTPPPTLFRSNWGGGHPD